MSAYSFNWTKGEEQKSDKVKLEGLEDFSPILSDCFIWNLEMTYGEIAKAPPIVGLRDWRL
jgi:hypothetical protein